MTMHEDQGDEVRVVRTLELPIVFPAGLAPGAGKGDGNRLMIARNGRGEPVLRGTALAGVLRSAWARLHRIDRLEPTDPDRSLARWFGTPLDGSDGRKQSPVRVHDMRLGDVSKQSELRNHHSRDRHTGAVRKGGLYSVEALPPGTRATLRLELWEANGREATDFLEELTGLVAAGLTFGGNSARGIGRAVVAGEALMREYDLCDRDQLALWLDDSWRLRSGQEPTAPHSVLSLSIDAKVLRIDMALAVPRGQDLCIGDGAGLDHTIEPQRVVMADGALRYRLPGSSLRGALRAWVTRLAARDLGPDAVADSVTRFEQGGSASGDEVGWGRVTEDARIEIQNALRKHPSRLAEHVKCPVMRLFGSFYASSRIHISDAFSAQSEERDKPQYTQSRKHVAVDAVTGGANDGFLFDHEALFAGACFDVTILIRDPEEMEVDWLVCALQAVNVGLVRIGTSKSSGRLALARPVRAAGPYHEKFQSLVPQEI